MLAGSLRGHAWSAGLALVWAFACGSPPGDELFEANSSAAAGKPATGGGGSSAGKDGGAGKTNTGGSSAGMPNGGKGGGGTIVPTEDCEAACAGLGECRGAV